MSTITTKNNSRSELGRELAFAARHDVARTLTRLMSTHNGLAADIAQAKLDLLGTNELSPTQVASPARRLFDAFVSPFTLILLALAAISLYTEVIAVAPESRDPSTAIIIGLMVVISGVLGYVQEAKSDRAAAGLRTMVTSTCSVTRRDPETDEPRTSEIPIAQVAVGDVVNLAAGDIIPGDARVVSAKDLFVAQAALTGESEPVEKTPDTVHTPRMRSGRRRPLTIADCSNILFAGTTVQSGSATAVVVATGDNTYLGHMAETLAETPAKTAFDQGIEDVSRVLVRFMAVMCPFVLLVNGLTKGDWPASLLFALSIAVGITPQMLPVIVTTCLARGATEMSRHDVIVKGLGSIQNLGATDVLCCDKTGTLTENRVILERHLDVTGRDDNDVLRFAYLNSSLQTGLVNLIDQAVIDATRELEAADPRLSVLDSRYEKIDEIPFDFERRRMSVVVREKATGLTDIVTKGAVEEVLSTCSSVRYHGKELPLRGDLVRKVEAEATRLGDEGLRVIAVARRSHQLPVGAFSVADESNMTLVGYLAFLDPPKTGAAEAIARLEASGVAVKVLTGDAERVAAAVCKKVGIDVQDILTGADVDELNDEKLAARAESCRLFAKLSPLQKARVVRVLREHGHTVGFLGDGINDAAAMRASDVGISVDTAVDVAKETANIILLKKDLMVLDHGIEEGRRTYVNTIKYIKMTAASNFGNVLSVMVASIALPFLPMTSLQLLLLGLTYTLAAAALPWDRVDEELLQAPQRWDAGSITKFMVWIGPTSSVFDLLTYAVLFWVVCPAIAGGTWHMATTGIFVAAFQTGWFIESMWSQTLVMHALRTEKLPFIESRASWSLSLLTALGVLLVTAMPYMPTVANALGLIPLPASTLPILLGVIIGYLVLVALAKKLYIRRFGRLL